MSEMDLGDGRAEMLPLFVLSMSETDLGDSRAEMLPLFDVDEDCLVKRFASIKAKMFYDDGKREIVNQRNEV